VADRRRYGNLKDQLANNYLLRTDQYLNTLDKALRILGNYQTTRVAGGFKANPNAQGSHSCSKVAKGAVEWNKAAKEAKATRVKGAEEQPMQAEMT
jgi:hypothetical protein